jgi:hypothetical protein
LSTTLRASLVVAIAALAGAGPASAHTRAPTVALDVRLRVTGTPAGVHAEVLDGDRALRLRVDRPVRVVVQGLVGEPVLRFGPDGVWVNRASPTAEGDRLTQAGTGWKRLGSAPALTWHDHRLAPPRGLGSTARWTLPLTVDGRRTALRGEFLRAARPEPWPWLAATVAAMAAVGAVWRYARIRRRAAATGLAATAALAALTASAAFATGDPIARAGKWLDVAAAGALALVALWALSIRRWSVRGWVTTLVGAVAAAIGLGSLSVFWHGFVISSLPASLARLATWSAVVSGLSAAVLAVAIGERK